MVMSNMKQEHRKSHRGNFADISSMVESSKSAKKRGRPRKNSMLTCALCDYQTDEHIYLQEHMKTHIDKVAFECPYCQTLFSQKGNLQAHIRTHTKERPFKCDLCPFAATQKGNLRVHYRKHTKERPYRCPICNFGAAQSANLRSHVVRKHSIKSEPNLWMNNGYSDHLRYERTNESCGTVP